MFKRISVRPLLFAGWLVAGCGPAGNVDESMGALDDEEMASVGQELVTKCTPPTTLVCPAPPPGGSKPVCFCLPPPRPPAQHFQLTPDFFITHVIHAPPGKSSSINYTGSSTIGTTTSATKGFKQDTKISAEASGSILATASVNIDAGTAWGNTRGDAVDVTESWSQGLKKPGQVDRIDHNYDEIWFLARPVLDMTFQPAGALATQPATASWKFAPADGVNTDIPQFVYAGWLNNAMQMPANVKAFLDFYGITPSKYATLLAADPLFTGSAPNQTMDPDRFDYVGQFPFEPPFAQGDQPTTQSYTVDQKQVNTSTRTSDASYSVGYKISGGVDVGLFTAKLSMSNSWTWTNSSSQKESTGTGTGESLTIGQPAYGYTGPTILHVYEDKLYKTYAFTLDWPQAETNLALGKWSAQSTDVSWLGAVAGRANDGNTDGDYWHGSVNHTDYGFVYPDQTDWPGQFWYVDLGESKIVTGVNIFNRTDCCSERLSHYNILAWSEMEGRWKVISNHAADDTSSVMFLHATVPMVKTQYVMVAKTDENYLHLAEVQVMGF